MKLVAKNSDESNFMVTRRLCKSNSEDELSNTEASFLFKEHGAVGKFILQKSANADKACMALENVFWLGWGWGKTWE